MKNKNRLHTLTDNKKKQQKLVDMTIREVWT